MRTAGEGRPAVVCRRMRTPTVTTGTLVATLLLAACGGADTESPDEPTSADSSAEGGGESDPGSGSDDAASDDPGDEPSSEDTEMEEAESGGGGCELLPLADVAAALGTEVAGSTSAPGGCIYDLPGDAGAFYQWQTVPAPSYRSNIEVAEQNEGLFELEEVAGLGIEAFQRNSLGGDGTTVIGTDLWVLLDEEEGLAVSAGLIDPAEMMESQQALAKLLVDRLG